MGSVEEDLLRHLQAQAQQRKASAPVTAVAPSRAQPDAPQPPTPSLTAPPQPQWKGAGIIGAFVALLLKFKTVALFLLTKGQLAFAGLKLLSLSKVLLTGGSMLVSIWAYAQFAPLSSAIGFVLLILVHEMGHVIALRWYGVKSSVPVFIPFIGAFVALKEMPKDVRIEAITALAGPVLGSFGALVCYRVYEMTGGHLWAYLAYIGFMINLFNLLPVRPLDGGRVAAAISPKAWACGLLGLCFALLVAGHGDYVIVIVLIVVLSFPMMVTTWKLSDRAEYYAIPGVVRTKLAVAYFGLAALLMLYTVAAHQALGHT